MIKVMNFFLFIQMSLIEHWWTELKMKKETSGRAMERKKEIITHEVFHRIEYCDVLSLVIRWADAINRYNKNRHISCVVMYENSHRAASGEKNNNNSDKKPKSLLQKNIRLEKVVWLFVRLFSIHAWSHARTHKRHERHLYRDDKF